MHPSELGTAPIQVVQYARSLFESGDRHKQIQPRAFEQVYAVFDRDDHASYFDALQLADSLDGKLRNDNRQAVRFQAIASVPSFELWLLLHFGTYGLPIQRRVMRRLRLHLTGYEKGGRAGLHPHARPTGCGNAAGPGPGRQVQCLRCTEPYTGLEVWWGC